MKRKIVSLLLAGCLVAKVGAVALAEELPEIVVTESVDNTAAENTSDTTVETPAETEITESSETESYDTTISDTEDDTTIDNVNGDIIAEEQIIVSNDGTNNDSSKEYSEGDTRFEIITNEDGTQKKIIYEYKIDEETGKLIEVVKDEIEGQFDEDGELIEDIEVDNENDEDLGKIIGFESLDDISFDHVPTIDELKASLPKTVVATIKGKEENSTQDIEIKFDESALEEIVIEDANNEDEESKIFTLEAEIATDIDVADGVSNPKLTITVSDPGIDYEYQELIDETTGISVKGVLPKGATLEISTQEVPESVIERIEALNESYDMEKDSCDTEFVDTSVVINVLDKDGNIYDLTKSDKQVLVTIPVQDESIEKIAGNKFTLLIDDEEIDHSFDKDEKVVKYLTNDLSKQVTVLGTQTHYFYNVRFEVLSTTEDDFEFSSEYRAEKGSDLTIPTFYSSEYPKLDTLTWDDVDDTVECDMVYTNYIDSTKYVADKGEIDDSISEVESYGDELVADGENIVSDTSDNTDDVNIDSENDESTVSEENVENSNSDNNESETKSSDAKKENESTNDTEVIIKDDILLPDSSESEDDAPVEN